MSGDYLYRYRPGAPVAYERVEMTVCGTCHGTAEYTWQADGQVNWEPCPDCVRDRDGRPTGFTIEAME